MATSCGRQYASRANPVLPSPDCADLVPKFAKRRRLEVR